MDSSDSFGGPDDSRKGSSKTLKLPKESFLKPIEQNIYSQINAKDKQYKLTLVPYSTDFGSNHNSRYWVLGAAFLHNYYSIYDFNTMRVGLVESKGEAGGIY